MMLRRSNSIAYAVRRRNSREMKAEIPAATASTSTMVT